jgi:Zn-dependent protease
MLIEILRVDPLAYLLIALSLVGAIAMHEFAHALAADAQGDRLPRAMGRVTLNPARHLDPLGTLCLLLAGFGWGRPVEFRPTALRSRRFGAALVALAGPGMNLLLAVAGAFVQTLMDDSGDTFWLFLSYFVAINVLLAVFNLIPLPPLDGSRLLTIFLPPRHQGILFFLDRYGFLILLVLIFFGGFRFVGPIVDTVEGAIRNFVG